MWSACIRKVVPIGKGWLQQGEVVFNQSLTGLLLLLTKLITTGSDGRIEKV